MHKWYSENSIVHRDPKLQSGCCYVVAVAFFQVVQGENVVSGFEALSSGYLLYEIGQECASEK